MAKKRKSSTKPIEFKRLRLIDGDVLVIKEPHEDEEYRKSVVERVDSTVNKDVLVVFVTRLSDIKLLTEQQMNNIGWYRK